MKKRDVRKIEIFLLFVLFLLFPSSGRCWNLAHGKITEAALNVLPEWQKEYLKKTKDSIIKKYCMYPDMAAGGSPEAVPYVIPVGPPYSAQFHYMPLTDTPANFTYFTKGASLYVEKIFSLLREGNVEEASKFMGYLFHVLQDAGSPIHSLEGFNGMNWWQLGEIIHPPGGSHPLFSPDAVFQVIVDIESRPEYKVNISGYAPAFLGTSTEEIVFHLYRRYVNIVRAGRGAAIPVAQSVYAGKTEEAVSHSVKAAEECARVCSDLAYTLLSVGLERIKEGDVSLLKRIDLTSIEPLYVPRITAFPYRFTPMVFNKSLGRYRQVYPLELWIDEAGQKTKKVFERGFSTGMITVGYEIPKGIFSHLEVTAGIHATLGADDWDGERLKSESPASFRMEIRLNGKTLWDSGEIGKNAPAKKVSVSIIEGGKLEFVSTNLGKSATNHANQPVWAEPVLIRAEK